MPKKIFPLGENLGKAVFISLSFGLLFKYMMSIGNEITLNILKSIKMKPIQFDSALDACYKVTSLPLMTILDLS